MTRAELLNCWNADVTRPRAIYIDSCTPELDGTNSVARGTKEDQTGYPSEETTAYAPISCGVLP